MSNLKKSSFGWFAGMISLALLIAFSSCSTNKETSLAYMDDIYKPYDINYLIAAKDDENDVSDQDASIIKPYRPTVPDYTPYTKPINFHMSFGYSAFYSGRYGYYCKPYGYYPRYYNSYAINYRGCYSPDWYILPFSAPSSGYYPINYGYGNDYGSPPGGSYVYGNNVSYFHGINSSERYNGTGVNYSKYVYYRASGSSGVVNTGRQSGSTGKSRYTSSKNKSTNKSNNNFNNSNYNSNGSYQSSPSGRSASPTPSRSSGSGGESYTGKRPR